MTALCKHLSDRRTFATLAVIVFLFTSFCMMGSVLSDDTEGSVTEVKSPNITYKTGQTQSAYNDSGELIMTLRISVDTSKSTDTNVFFEYEVIEAGPARNDYDSIDMHWHPENDYSVFNAFELTNSLEDDGDTYGGIGTMWNINHTIEFIFRNGGGSEGKAEPGSDDAVIRFEMYTGQTTKYRYVTSVSYDANGGSSTPTSATTRTDTLSSTSTANVNLTLPSTVPTHPDGLIFAGWCKDSSGAGTLYPARGSIPVQYGSEITVYAIWTNPTYTISLVTDDESSPWQTATVEKGQTYTPPNPPAPEGKIFEGWYTDNTYTVRYTPGPASGDDTLYAKFVDELSFTTTPSAQENVTAVEPHGTFVFDSMTSDSASKVLWEFSDGTTSMDRITTHWFDAGTHHVKLTVWNSLGEESVREFDVTVSEDGDDGFPMLWAVAGILAIAIVIVLIWRFVL